MIFSTDLSKSYFSMLPKELYLGIACYYYNSPLPTSSKLNLLAPEVILDTYKDLAEAAKLIEPLQQRVINMRECYSKDNERAEMVIQGIEREIIPLALHFQGIYSKVLIKELSKKENLFSLCEAICGGSLQFKELPEIKDILCDKGYKQGKIQRAHLPFDWKCDAKPPDEHSTILSIIEYTVFKIWSKSKRITINVFILPNYEKDLDIEYNLKIFKYEKSCGFNTLYVTDLFHPKKVLDPSAFLEVCELVTELKAQRLEKAKLKTGNQTTETS